MSTEAYTVDKKEEFSKLIKGGDVTTYYRIWATTHGGTYFHIDVAEADLDKAASMLEMKAKRLDGIK